MKKASPRVFTLSGGFCNPALEGMAECGMSVINTPHEQVAGHLADGFTRISRSPTVCLVGPEGFANAIPAMMEAWGDAGQMCKDSINMAIGMMCAHDEPSMTQHFCGPTAERPEGFWREVDLGNADTQDWTCDVELRSFQSMRPIWGLGS